MTVVREQKAIFNVAAGTLAGTLKVVLHSNRIYQNVEVSPDGYEFTVKVTPNLLISPARMTMQIVPEGAQTLLIVRVTSQWFILADPSNIYNRAIVNLLAAVRQEGSHGLLRASSAPDMISETLLRPASGSSSSAEELLRATDKAGE